MYVGVGKVLQWGKVVCNYKENIKLLTTTAIKFLLVTCRQKTGKKLLFSFLRGCLLVNTR